MRKILSMLGCSLTFALISCTENDQDYIKRIKAIKANNGDSVERIVDHHIIAGEFLEINHENGVDLKLQSIVSDIILSELEFGHGDKEALERMSDRLLKEGTRYPDIENINWKVAYKGKGVTVIEVTSDNVRIRFPIFEKDGTRTVNFAKITVANKKRGIVDINQLNAAHEIIHFIGNDDHWI
ncbi:MULTISPECIES: hypothetical protein [unclassified Fusobacterium]|uniref:hypothetical protein n=1 Tax=unclassified Fusobacterium TaxID=2648384 RepID=UPI001B8AFC51|nr:MULTISPECIES: hypothetical protein [unclassified Fusobacterium]MBR8700856.1 hypothetical protein [Fusobacterium sp. DD45]MBR8710605.1 hypothetical protein [Fusobacterium sp. DD28]MBR8751206.1 hypothetical protein [Fusobacterium sp. DD26]